MYCCKDCLKEGKAQHLLSPGVVCCSEEIALVLINPDQWKDGDFSSAAFSKSKLQLGEMSVCRVNYTTVKDVEGFVIAPQLEKKEERVVEGVAVADCLAIRQILSDDMIRLFCVIDAPIIYEGKDQEYLGHAHISFSDPTHNKGFWANNNRRAALANLAEAFRKRAIPSTINEVFHKE